MELHNTDLIEAPRDQVYELVRDKLPEVAKYLPSIDKIEQLEYERADGKVRIVNHWYAKAQVPGMLKKFVSDELFSWKDTAVWDEETGAVDYELESFFANDLFSARGHNTFVADGDDRTRMELRCDVEIHADKIPGVPGFMSKKVQPTVEGLIKKMLQPNMTSLGDGLRGYLAAH